MESAVQQGDYLSAMDHASIIQIVAKGDPRLRAIMKQITAWHKEPSYQSGQVLYRILIGKATAPEEEFQQIMAEYKRRFPNSLYLKSPWYFQPK